MASNEEKRKELALSLHKYNINLTEVEEALRSAADGKLKDELDTLRDQLKQVIQMTKEELETSSHDAIDFEYALFKAELELNENDSEKKMDEVETDDNGEEEEEETSSSALDETNKLNTIFEEMSSLVGNKCRAPFDKNVHEDEDRHYHNAVIIGVEAPQEQTSEDYFQNFKITKKSAKSTKRGNSKNDIIQVKVLFTNPMMNKMLPCPYYMQESDCKFDSEHCRYSHGHLVQFSALREYSEPDFRKLKEDVIVLAKNEQNLWERARVMWLVGEGEDKRCRVRFELGGKSRGQLCLQLHDVLPPSRTQSTTGSFVTEDSEGKRRKSKRSRRDECRSAERTERDSREITSATQSSSCSKFGEWEKYTNSIGSRLMASMGYVAGSGLGKDGQGRVDPIVADVLPVGRSLDYCMALKEKAKAGGNQNLFQIDQLQQKLQLTEMRRQKKLQRKETQQTSSDDFFAFVNRSISKGDQKNNHTDSDRERSKSLKVLSTKNLNVEELKTNERIRKEETKLHILYETISRQNEKGSGAGAGVDELRRRIASAEHDIRLLNDKKHSIQKEQSYRQTIKKLTVF